MFNPIPTWSSFVVGNFVLSTLTSPMPKSIQRIDSYASNRDPRGYRLGEPHDILELNPGGEYLEMLCRLLQF